MTKGKGLTKDHLVDAAVALVDAEGVEALTLSRLARELGVKPPSLYNHVDGLDMLRRDVALHAVEDLGRHLGTAAMGRSGREALHAIAAAFRSFVTAHPSLYELSTRARPDDAPYAAAGFRSIEPVVAILRSYQADEDEAIHAARMLRSALHGFVTLESVGGFGLDVDVDASYDWLVDHLASTLEASFTST